MDYFTKFLESDSFLSVARIMITKAEDITFTIIGEDLTIRWVNDLALSLSGKPMEQVVGTHYLSWYKDDLEITEHQFAQAREKGLSDNALVTATSGAYVRRRIFKIDDGYISICIDFSRIADADERTRNIDATIKVLADSKNRMVREAQLEALDKLAVHCRSLCKYTDGNEDCPPMERARDEILEGRPVLPVSLTNAEMNVARLVREGLSRKEIASRLGISDNTVRNHSTAIRRKCGLKTRDLRLAEYLQRFRT